LTFDAAMDRAGGLGLFQILAITAFSVCYVSNGYIFYALTYLELWPDYKCGSSIDPKSCDRDLMCKNPNDPALISVDESSTRTLINWVDRLHLICEPSWKIGLIGSMYLLGWAIGCLVIPRLGDLYGRKIPCAASIGPSLLVHMGLILSQNIYLTMVLFWLLGLTCPGKSNIAYVYLLELVPTKMQTYVGTALLFADGSTMIFLSLYFRFISKNWLWFQIFALSLTTLAFLVTLIAPESPKYLFSYKKYKEARKALEKIA
jgi:MFS family permease